MKKKPTAKFEKSDVKVDETAPYIIINKNIVKLTSFAQYCGLHPEDKFWQALRNWKKNYK